MGLRTAPRSRMLHANWAWIIRRVLHAVKMPACTTMPCRLPSFMKHPSRHTVLTCLKQPQGKHLVGRKRDILLGQQAVQRAHLVDIVVAHAHSLDGPLLVQLRHGISQQLLAEEGEREVHLLRIKQAERVGESGGVSLW